MSKRNRGIQCRKRESMNLFVKCYLYFILQLRNDLEKVPFRCIYVFCC
uniref:Uncharacterized protein n=1 Tax=Anguilla anguilla TaxID=7936 RepID=A0A0E9S2R2_ANGAN